MLTRLIIAAMLSSLCSGVLAANVTLTIKGIPSDSGVIRLALFDKAEAFPDDEEKSVMKISLAAEKDEVVARLVSVPEATYALTVFHDANSNGILDRNFAGVPIEVYGFSNNARGVLGAPTFKKASFKVGKTNQEMVIELK